MTLPPAPIRFVLLLVGGWIGFRAIVLWPGAPALEIVPAVEAAPVPSASAAARALPPLPADASPLTVAPVAPSPWQRTAFLLSAAPMPSPPVRASPSPAPLVPTLIAASSVLPSPLDGSAISVPGAPRPMPRIAAVSIAQPSPLALAPIASPNRLSASAWLFLRDDIGATLAPGGTLGGSQAGLRVNWRLNSDTRRPLSVSARLYAPVSRPRGSEVALGLDWLPFAALPLHILAERRQRIGAEGRSDFALTLYGGVDRLVLRGRAKIEAYGQAGIVGVEERDLFADGAVRVAVPIGPVEIGGGAWGGAQPGLSRLDIGPSATVRLRVGGTTIRASADYRFRIAGDAAPASGPALTLAADF